jgi:small subunit ribosomal protein S2
MAIATMRQLLEAGIHFGHQTRRWHPKMQRYIYGQRNGIYIIDLQHTLRQLYKSYALVRDAVANGGTVLFVGTKKQAQESVQEQAKRCGMYYVTNRWLGGTLTNFRTVREGCLEYTRLLDLEATGRIDKFGKKEGIILRKRRAKLEKNLSGIATMPSTPDVLFVIDTKAEHIAVKEARRLGIPCIGVVDTNCDPDEVNIPIPGNDDAIRAVQLYCSVIADAVLEGRMRHEKVKADEDAAQRARRASAQKQEAAPEVVAEVEAEAAVEQPAEAEAEAVAAAAE